MNNIHLYTPKVREVCMFKEIAQNIVNPLEIIREGISNSVDAESKKISIVTYRNESGKFIIEMKDNGKGMNLEQVHRFFNLGDSNKNLAGIGQKGLGTKTYYKSNKITIHTQTNEEKAYKAIMNRPWQKLKKGEIPKYSIMEVESEIGKSGTTVTIEGYIVDNPEKYFNFQTMKDYILWFTAAGSFKTLFANHTELHNLIKNMQIAPRIYIDDRVGGINGEIAGTHQFSPPEEMPKVDTDQLIYKRSVNYCRHIGPFNRETNLNGEYVSVQIYGSVSGVNCRRSICKLRQGETLKSRYGLYLAKDFIPFSKSLEFLQDPFYHHYHILVNSQNFELTADRNNISNINDAKVKWVFQQVQDIISNYIKPLAENGYFKMRKYEEEEYAIKCKKENIRKSFKSLNKLDNLMIDSIPILKKPSCESQVSILFVALLSNEYTKSYIKDIDKIVIYSSKGATDMICTNKDNKEILVETEFKLSNLFKHGHPLGTFDYVVCWEVDLEVNQSIELYAGCNLILFKENGKYVLKYSAEKVIPVIELKSIVNSILKKDKSFVKVIND